VVVEVGTRSPWVVALLEELGHEVIAANPRKLRLIYENDRKSDRVDAECLARLGAWTRSSWRRCGTGRHRPGPTWR
jgi:transposase